MVTPLNSWTPGHAYGSGSTIVYEGAAYRIVQPHTSQIDWAPPITPALWEKLQSSSSESSSSHHNDRDTAPPVSMPIPDHDHAQAPLPIHQSGPPPNHDSSHPTPANSAVGIINQYAQAPFPVHRGGGGAGGAGGASTTGGLTEDGWLSEARHRAEQFRAHGPTAPTTWLLHEGDGAPADSLPIPGTHDHDMHIRRQLFEGDFLVGAHFPKRPHEVLVGDPRALKWIDVEGHLRQEIERERPVEAGVDRDGRRVHVGISEYHGEPVVGRVVVGEALTIRKGISLHTVDRYRVLCYL